MSITGPPAAATIEGTSNLADPLNLQVDIAEIILAIAVQRAAIASLWDPKAMIQPLNVLPRSAAPLATKVTLIHLPHVDLDTATRLNDVGLLRFMRGWSKLPGGRPVNYQFGTYLAMSHGHLAAFEWWADESDLCSRWEGGLDDACAYGHLHILEAWAARGFPYLQLIENPIRPIQYATANGHVHILNWLYEHLPNAQELFSKAAKDHSTWSDAAAADSIAVLDWWYEKSQSGLITASLFAMAGIVTGAFKAQNRVHLEWCQAHPQVVKHYCQRQRGKKKAVDDTLWWYAMQDVQCDWIDALDLLPPNPAERWRAAYAACVSGNVYALAWLRNKDYLVGSRQQLLALAIVEREQNGNSIPSSEILDWIDKHVDPAIPEYFTGRAGDTVIKSAMQKAFANGWLVALDLLLRYGIQLPSTSTMDNCFQEASRSGNVQVLDWLVSNYHLSPSQLHALLNSFEDALRYTNASLCPEVFEWWRTQFQLSNMELPTDFVVILNSIRSVAELNWWIELPPTLKDQINLRFVSDYDAISPSCYCEDPVGMLQLWITSGLPLELDECIRWAFAGGELELLDWFVEESRVSAQDLMACYQGMVESGGILHLQSALWCWAKCPPPLPDPACQDAWFHFQDPIHAHLVQVLLKGVHVTLPDAERASRQENVPMLEYLKSCHRLSVDKDCPADKMDLILVASSSGYGSVPVLDWCEKRSGVALTRCPERIAQGEQWMCDGTRKWWEAFGRDSSQALQHEEE